MPKFHTFYPYFTTFCIFLSYFTIVALISDVPGPPGIPDISDIDSTKMTLTWTPPKDNGGADILGYVIEKCEHDRKRWVKAHKEDMVTDLTYVVRDLQEGFKYMFRVSAENIAGVGESSEATPPTKARPPYGE